MLRKGMIFMLCLTMALGCLTACGSDNSKATTPGSSTASTAAATGPATEPTEPDDGSFKAYYDDRISISELGGNEASTVEIRDQEVSSYIVGSSDPDASVLYYDEANAQLIAVGTGTAIVVVDGSEQLVRVRPAPISLFMITGHSIGAGQEGNAAQSVVCQPGQTYSTHKTATFQNATSQMGLGYLAPARPEGIDAFAPGGGGTIGEGSALAYKWNQLTGEKVWVLNAAVGGSVIPEWIQGEKYYAPAVAMYHAAAQVLANEVAAGHYTLKNTAIIYHSAANFGYKNVEFTDEVMEFWYDSMINGFKQDLAFDITGDGTAETVDAIGFLPLWSSSEKGTYGADKPINYYLALSDAYPGCFIVAETMRNWCDDSALKENFPAIEYTTQSQPVEMPTNSAALKAEDGVHYTQVTYNAAGLEIGENLYNYFRTEVQPESIVIYTSNGIQVKDELNFKRVGATYSLIAELYPCYASDLTITLSDNLSLTSPFTVKATASGEGFITISKGDQVIHRISVTVKD